MLDIARWLELSSYRSILTTLPIPIVAICIAALSPASAHVHHGADGSTISWYPTDCCHDGDCHPVSRIQMLSDGLLMTTDDGTTLYVNPTKSRRESRDGRWHICFGTGENPDIRCIFAPPNS
ncbi:hypothetical protein [Bradyrhizobium commune]|uniref:Uncharacterized protein n=1 Tax=Bradyrhizobium commune TaxID=83627 RepID=A0A7S9H2T3_9BRAD|nr:hypothetical protein [Bradyrhizobium commune]QPF94366.1 hypothetical protein IC761_14290 [Bradyrhizobium commune]